MQGHAGSIAAQYARRVGHPMEPVPASHGRRMPAVRPLAVETAGSSEPLLRRLRICKPHSFYHHVTMSHEGGCFELVSPAATGPKPRRSKSQPPGRMEFDKTESKGSRRLLQIPKRKFVAFAPRELLFMWLGRVQSNSGWPGLPACKDENCRWTCSGA